MLEAFTVRRRYLFVLDAVMLVLSFLMAVALRFETVPSIIDPIRDQLPLLAVSLVVRPIFFFAFGLYRRVWRYATVADLASSVAANLTASVAVFALNFGVLRALGVSYAASYSVVLLDALISLGFITGIRVLRKLATQIPPAPQRRPAVREPNGDRALIVGANSAGELLVRQMMQDPSASATPVGFVDDNRVMRRMTIHGVPVLGAPSELEEVIEDSSIDLVIIAGTTDPAAVRDVVAVGKRMGVPVKTAGFVASDLREYQVAAPSKPTQPADASRARTSDGTPPDSASRFDLAVIGLGYVGLPIVIAASKVGLRVLGLDVDRSKIDLLSGGQSHIEDVTDEEVQAAIAGGFVATDDPALLAGADTISISVPTPLADDMPDLSAVIAAARDVGRNLVRGQLVILESTTYPGTTEEVVLPILEGESGLRAGTDFDVAYSPERIDPGNREFRVENVPKLVGGYGVEAGERAAAFYGKFCTEVITLSGTREAEMAKLLENTYRHVNIALVNEMAMFCNELGVDIWEAIRGASTKPFGFQPFYPGPGVGGHCIPIDPGYLSYRVRQLGGEAKFVELAQEINNYMPQYVVDRAESILAGRGVALAGADVLVLGVAYKAGVSDTRETPATPIVRALRQRGARVRFADPLVPAFAVDGEPVERVDDPVAGAAAADLVILHTNHAELDLAAISDRAAALLDTRGVMAGEGVERL